MGQPAMLTAAVRAGGGWFGGVTELPDLPIDTSIITEEDLAVFVTGLKKTGFFGGDSWYMNHEANGVYAKTAPNGGKLEFPVLMIHARYDYVCESVESKLADPMRADCPDLTEFTISAGHWVAQEKPAQTSAAIVQWLSRKLPQLFLAQGGIAEGAK
jgi:pimeloyl-ACP methyl ester carboxylesterase